MVYRTEIEEETKLIYAGLFFYVDGKFLVHRCEMKGGETYGNFVGYPKSHLEIWERNYLQKYHVDFDYYPRGRFIYDREVMMHRVYRDLCIPDEILEKMIKSCIGEKYLLLEDDHYQCHLCNPEYAEIYEDIGE